MKLGLIARMDNGGLGNETWEAYRHLLPHKTLVVDLSDLNNNKQYPDRYPGDNVRFHKGFLDGEAMDWITKDVDVLLTYEIPYNYQLFTLAKVRKVKTILRANWEFLDYLNQPKLPMPDVIASPSTWYYKEMREMFGDRVKMLLTPVDQGRLPFRKIEQIKTFIHVAGVKLFEDRNGTELVLDAIPLVKNKAKFIIYSQHDLPVIKDKRVEVRGMVENYWELYKEGDCLLLPRRFGGQSLQLNEAMSCGMIPIMLDCEPNNRIVDDLSLVPVTGSKKVMTRTVIDCFTTSPALLADKIDEFITMSENRVVMLNTFSDMYANSISWKKLLPHYEKMLSA